MTTESTGQEQRLSPVLVTGATGFLGREVSRQLGSQGVGLTLLDHQLGQLCKHDIYANVRAFDADITDREKLVGPFHGAKAVIHAAGLAHVFDRSSTMDDAFWRVNADGSENVARAAAEAGVAAVRVDQFHIGLRATRRHRGRDFTLSACWRLRNEQVRG